jgi:hypothetical protein
MTRAPTCAIAAILVLGQSAVFAGDLAELPKDDSGFREKVAVFIKQGDKAADAQRILEMHRFRCQEQKDAEGPFVWCSRSDKDSMSSVQQRYQVVMRLGGHSVTAVKTSTGLVGP